MDNAKQDDVALKIDTALYTIEKTNPSLKGALPDNYYSRLQIDTVKLASLLDEINKIDKLKIKRTTLSAECMSISLANLLLQKEKERENSIHRKHCKSDCRTD